MPSFTDRPIEELLFFVAEDLVESMPGIVSAAIDKLTDSRDWLLAPPEFFDESTDDNAPVDEGPRRVLGGALKLYSVMPPTQIPLAEEQRQWEEAYAFIRTFQDLSSKHHWELECYYRNELIGDIEDGIMGASLTDGFLGEWKQAIDDRSRTQAQRHG